VIALLLTLLLAAVLLVAHRLRRIPENRARADLRTIFHTAPIPNVMLDGDDLVLAANAALGRTVGEAPGDLLGQPLQRLVHADDLALLRIAFAQLRHGVTAELATEVRLLAADGTTIASSIHAALLASRKGKAPRLLVQALDISEHKRVEAQLQHMADHDPLTGLLNRRRFEHELERHVATGQRYGAEGAVIVLDVDGFKRVNDTRGHAAGDRLIAHVAAVLRARLRGTDLVARLGGDEFAILLPKADRAGAEVVARSLFETVRAAASAAADGAAPVTISLGAVMVDSCPELTIETLVAAADHAMYAAKAAGRDGYAFASGADVAAPVPRRLPSKLAV
jgi:diguanylate cyclase (GGDEF)-like protein/PAS domain S-box-containing protein